MGDLLSIRKLVVRETANQPQFNNARAIIVLAEQDSWATCGSLHQRLSSCTPTWIFLANFAAVASWAMHVRLLSYESKSAGRLVDHCVKRLQSCAPGVIFLPNFAAVVTWAVREKANVQQRRCHYLPIVRYMWCVKPEKLNTEHQLLEMPQTVKVQRRTCHYWPTRAKHLSDLWTAAPTTLELHPDEKFFWQILLSWGGRYVRYVLRETVKVEHWTPATWSGASLTQWKNVSEHCAKSPTALELHPDVNFFGKFYCHYRPTRAKQLGDLWIAEPTTPELRPGVNFFSKFCCPDVWRASFDKRTLILITLSSRFASVVRWAVPQTAKVQ